MANDRAILSLNGGNAGGGTRILVGEGAPLSTPLFIGDKYIDLTNGDVYYADGVAGPANWIANVAPGIGLYDIANSVYQVQPLAGIQLLNTAFLQFGTGVAPGDVTLTPNGTDVVGTGTGNIVPGTVGILPSISQLAVAPVGITPLSDGVVELSVPDLPTGNLDFTLPVAARLGGANVQIIDAWFVKTNANAAAANTVQVQTGAGAAITDVISTNINDTLIARATQIDDATATIPAGGTLRVRSVKAGGDATGLLYVRMLVK